MSNTKEKQWEVWTEGWAATGEGGPATLLGKAIAPTFREACQIVITRKKMNDGNWDPKRLTYWGCKLYDSEKAARKSFG